MQLRQDLAGLLAQLRDEDVYKFSVFYQRYEPHLAAIASGLYDRLPPADRVRFLHWFLKRWAKIDLVNAVERGLYDNVIDQVKHEARPVVELNGQAYRLRDFKSQGHDFSLLGYDWFLGVHDVLYDQYESASVALAPDDVIIDVGAFIGDTAVFFHHKLAGRCRIHSFELLDENLALLQHNLERNGVADDCVVLNKLALADRTGDEIVIAKGASQGSTSIFGKALEGDRVQTVTLDDYVVSGQLDRVDFIKMDIEGSEVQALKGALHTIGHFKPKLAICLYHLWDDAFTIPPLIHASGVTYDFSFKWVQLSDGWEAVLLATPSSQAASAAPATPSTPSSADEALKLALATMTRSYIKKWGQADSLWRDKLARQATDAQAVA